MNGLPDLLSPPLCASGAVPDLVGFGDQVSITQPVRESAPHTTGSGWSYAGAADVHDDPPEARQRGGASGGSAAGDAARTYNAVVYLPGLAALSCPAQARIRWTSDRAGLDPGVSGVVEAVRRSDGALLVRFP